MSPKEIPEPNCDSDKVMTLYEKLQKASNAQKNPQDIKWVQEGKPKLNKAQIFLSDLKDSSCSTRRKLSNLSVLWETPSKGNIVRKKSL